MSYEESKPFIVTDEGGDYVSQHATLEEAESALREHFSCKDSAEERIGLGQDACVYMLVSLAEYDFSNSDLYTLHKTTAYQSIQEQLSELERVKAERDAYRSCLIEAGAIYEDTPPMDQFAADVIGGAIKIEHEGNDICPECMKKLESRKETGK